MRVRVHFRVNAATGEVEEFLIEDISTKAEPEHDAKHDKLAVDIGKVVERRPAPQQVVNTGPAGDQTPLTYRPGDELPAMDQGEEATE